MRNNKQAGSLPAQGKNGLQQMDNDIYQCLCRKMGRMQYYIHKTRAPGCHSSSQDLGMIDTAGVTVLPAEQVSFDSNSCFIGVHSI